MAQDGSSGIEIFYGGGTVIPPSPEFTASANATENLVRRAAADPIGYWEDEARKLSWFQSWDKALEWNAPDAKWFVGGKLNVSYNCLDRHVEAGRGSPTTLRASPATSARSSTRICWMRSAAAPMPCASWG